MLTVISNRVHNYKDTLINVVELEGTTLIFSNQIELYSFVRLNVFVSSRFEELKDERALIKHTLSDSDFE